MRKPRVVGRRAFVRDGAIAMLALGMPPEFLARPLLAARSESSRPGRRKSLVCIFQRGASDGLSAVVPFGEQALSRARRSIAIPAPGRDGSGAIDLDGFFGLHPSLDPLVELYRRGEMGIVHAVGSPHPTRSHFEAQDLMESGTAGEMRTTDGWLNRALAETACPDCSGRTLVDPERHALDHGLGQGAMGGHATFRAVAVGGPLPLSLKGATPTLAIADLERSSAVGGGGTADAIAALHRTDAGDELSATAADAAEAVRIMETLRAERYRPSLRAQYPAGPFGRSLAQIAQMIKADVGVEVAFADIGGWDTHVGQGAVQGALARQLGQLGQGLRALYEDLGDRMEDVVILTMSEFGRTVAENGSGGTDHGHANCLFVLGGQVDGGVVRGDWPGLESEQLYQGRDLAVTTDFRDVFAEVASGHLGVDRLDRVFPGYDVRPERFRGILR